MVETEVIVVGAGPAGTTCARELRRAGVECLVLDRCGFPRPKPCAGWITPRVFDRLELGAYPHSLLRLDGLDFHFRGGRVRVPTVQYSIRRTELDAWLLERCGAPFQRHEVRRIERRNGAWVVDDAFSCRFLVGAGGTSCPVRRALFPPRDPEAMIATMEEELACEARDDACRLWFFDNGLPGYSWCVPKGHGILSVGIGGVARALKATPRNIRDHWELLARKLEALDLVSGHGWHPKGCNYYVRRGPTALRAGNVLLAGDAAGLATKDLGEGIGPAVESGIRAAAAIARGAPYRAAAIPRWSLPGILAAGLQRGRRP